MEPGAMCSCHIPGFAFSWKYPRLDITRVSCRWYEERVPSTSSSPRGGAENSSKQCPDSSEGGEEEEEEECSIAPQGRGRGKKKRPCTSMCSSSNSAYTDLSVPRLSNTMLSRSWRAIVGVASQLSIWIVFKTEWGGERERENAREKRYSHDINAHGQHALMWQGIKPAANTLSECSLGITLQLPEQRQKGSYFFSGSNVIGLRTYR
jgi:hypothetical protein